MITGFPIVSEKKCSHTVHLSRRDFTEETNDEKVSAEPFPSSNNSTFVSEKDDIIVPLILYRDKDVQDERNPSVDGVHAEFSITQSNPKRRFTVIMNIEYYHVIRRTCMVVSNRQEQEETVTTLQTNVSTIAQVQIFLSPWSSENIQLQTEQSQINRFVCSTFEMEEEINGTFDEIENSSRNILLPKYSFGDVVAPKVAFSKNEKYLACIIPRPIRHLEESSDHIHEDPPLSIVAIFPLSPPKLEEEETENFIILPQPSYLQTKNVPANVDPTVLPPSIGKAYTLHISPDIDIDNLNSSSSKWITQIVSIADYSFSGLHLLLGGCSDGSLVIINYKRATLLGSIFTSKTSCAIRDLQCFKTEDHIKIGAVYNDGRVEVYKSYMDKKGIKGIDREIQLGTCYHDLTCNIKYNPFHIRTWLMMPHLSPKICSGLKFDKLCFVNERTIATLVRPLQIQCGKEANNLIFDDTIAQVWLLDPLLPNPALLSTLKMDCSAIGNLDDDETKCSFCLPHMSQVFCGFIEFDSRSNCILISSLLPNHRSISNYPIHAKAFVTLWDWQTATTAITMPYFFDTVRFVCKHKLQLFWDLDRVYLLREYASVDSFTRDQYHVVLLSPSRYIEGQHRIRSASQILFEHDSVAYPSLLERSSLKDWQVQWKYAKIPSNYIDNNGAIQTAIVGDRYGKTLVLAGSTGISVLSMNTGIHAGKHNKSYLSCRSGVYYDGIRIQHIHIQDKWKMFRRRDERKVVISSMVLWENYIDNGDDLIIAIASYRGHANCEDSDTYLVAWSSGGIDLKKQLLVPLKNKKAVEIHPLGIRLDPGNNPARQNINVLHSRRRSGNTFEAALLITNYDGHLLSYQLFQLSASEDKQEANGQVICNDIAGGILNQAIPDISAVFLARYSFLNSDIESEIATIGVIFNHGMTLSAFSVTVKGQGCVCQVFDSCGFNIASRRLIQFWSEDEFLSESSVEESWTWNLVLSNGSLLTWNTSRSDNVHSMENGFVYLHRYLHCDCINDNRYSEKCHEFGMISMETECISCSKFDPGAYLLGPLPNCTNRHLMYVSQKFQIRHNDGTDISLFGVSDFNVGVPSNAPSLLLLLSKISNYEMSGKFPDSEALVMNLVNSVRSLRAYESTFSSLRTIAAFLTDLFLRISKKGPKVHQKHIVLESIQSLIVRVAMHSLVRIQFASLFLGVGRQLEAHHFEYLYPLPISWNASEGSKKLTLLDIFAAAVNDGSFSIPAGALPLIPDQQTVHNLCINLLHHTICSLTQFENSRSLEVDCLREELASLRQLFLYSLKLEDAQCLHLSRQNNIFLNAIGEIEGDGSHSSSDGVSRHDRMAYNPRMLKKLLLLFNPFHLTKKHASECQISEAASSFILNGYGGERHTLNIGLDSSISEGTGRSSDSFIEEGNEENSLFHITSSVMLSMSITFKVFLKNTSTKTGIQNLPAMSVLMLNGDETVSNFRVQKWLCDITKDELLDLVLVRRRILHINQSFESLLKVLIFDCEKSWNQYEANSVACCIQTILSKGDGAPDVQIFFTGLKLVLLAGLHVSRDNETLASSSFKYSDLGNIYQKFNEKRLN